jgi:hypothetical protein
MDRSEQAMTPMDPDYAARVRTSFGRQQAMALLGAEMTDATYGTGPGSLLPWCQKKAIAWRYRQAL